MSKQPETHAETPAVAAKHGGRLLAPARYRHPGDVIRLILDVARDRGRRPLWQRSSAHEDRST